MIIILASAHQCFELINIALKYNSEVVLIQLTLIPLVYLLLRIGLYEESKCRLFHKHFQYRPQEFYKQNVHTLQCNYQLYIVPRHPDYST